MPKKVKITVSITPLVHDKNVLMRRLSEGGVFCKGLARSVGFFRGRRLLEDDLYQRAVFIRRNRIRYTKE